MENIIKKLERYIEDDEVTYEFDDAIEELERTLTEEQKRQLDEIIELFYKTEEYYFAFSYTLGMKYGEELKRL